MRLGSLFDGSGGFPLAGSLCGVEPSWAAEVEPYPIAVTKSRFPTMKHLGDISKINGAEIEPVDIITFGSPCQDLSIAGKRAGLKHEANGDEEATRSGLFMEAVRIIREMRKVTNGKYPTFALWENVPGAFSSNKGDDFRVVLEELIKIVEPTAKMPPCGKNGWPYADCYMGAGWSLAYRTFDAQCWGVPQRRRRIHLVLDLRGERAHKVLFEREGLRGHLAEGRTPRQSVAGDAENCAGAADREGHGGLAYTLKIRSGCEGGGKGALIQTDKSATLSTLNDQYLFQPVSEMVLDDQGGQQMQVRTDGMERKSVYCLQGSMIGRTDKNGPQGDGVNEDVAFTCNTIDRHAVAYVDTTHADDVDRLEDVVAPLQARGYKGGKLAAETHIVRRLTPTECARLQGFPDKWGHPDHKDDFTDAEYCFWLDARNTHAAINDKSVKEYTKAQMLTWYNKLHTDSAEYKMWGNGIALPPALYCMQGIVEALKAEPVSREEYERVVSERDELLRYVKELTMAGVAK